MMMMTPQVKCQILKIEQSEEKYLYFTHDYASQVKCQSINRPKKCIFDI